jgi:hypothetical protein
MILHPLASTIRVTMNTVYATIYYFPSFFILLSVATCFGLTDHHQVIHIQFHENYSTYNGSIVFNYCLTCAVLMEHIWSIRTAHICAFVVNILDDGQIPQTQ